MRFFKKILWKGIQHTIDLSENNNNGVEIKKNIDESAGDLVESLSSKQAQQESLLDIGELQYTIITITITIEFIWRTLYCI